MALPVFQKTVVDNAGNVRIEAEVYVRDVATDTTATIYTDSDGAIQKDNPFKTDLDGLARFYAVNGIYDIEVTSNGNTVNLKDVNLFEVGSVKDVFAQIIDNKLLKEFKNVPAFSVVGAEIKPAMQLTVLRNGIQYIFNSTDVINLPTLVKGEDYFIYFDETNSLTAVLHDTVPHEDSLLIGGFHTQDTLDPLAIKENSVWDDHFRPIADPRGMVYDKASNLWFDIYQFSTTTILNGYTKVGQPVLTGSTWWEAVEYLGSLNKQLPHHHSLVNASNGVENGTSEFVEPVNTGFILNRQSLSGIEQITGCYWHWSAESILFGGAVDTGLNSGTYSFDDTKDRNYVDSLVSFRGTSKSYSR